MAQFTQHKKTALLFILPQMLVTLFFFIWPACNALVESMYISDAFGLHQQFVGLANFIELIQRTDYRDAIGVTLIIALAITLLTLGLGLLLAMLVHGCKKSQGLYKTMLLWPYAVAPAVAGIIWRLLCHPTLGWFTLMAHYWGFDFNYLIHPKQALLVVILAASWQQFSYNFLFYFAALKLVPTSIIEAAMLDGAKSYQRFWQIIFPLISPTTFFLFIMNLLYAFFDIFAVIQVVTNGGPGNSTTTLIYKVYQDGFIGMDPGGSAAQSVILMIFVVLFTLLQFRYLEQKVHYQ